jgi:mono/diheme cytochrome c family protein
MRPLIVAALLAAVGCGRLPGKPAPGPEVPRPDSILDPVALYSTNCAGCHGADGTHGPAMALADPVYLSIADDDTLRTTVARGRSGTAMSAFSQKEGGTLTEEQIDSIVRGIRERWGARGGKSAPITGEATPPYASGPGNPQQGHAVYTTFCASCHGGVGQPGSITDPAYLSLISNQGLRTIVITGRPDFGAPDWRGNLPGRPMTDQEISDVVAWLTSQRPSHEEEADSSLGRLN